MAPVYVLVQHVLLPKCLVTELAEVCVCAGEVEVLDVVEDIALLVEGVTADAAGEPGRGAGPVNQAVLGQVRPVTSI